MVNRQNTSLVGNGNYGLIYPSNIMSIRLNVTNSLVIDPSRVYQLVSARDITYHVFLEMRLIIRDHYNTQLVITGGSGGGQSTSITRLISGMLRIPIKYISTNRVNIRHTINTFTNSLSPVIYRLFNKGNTVIMTTIVLRHSIGSRLQHFINSGRIRCLIMNNMITCTNVMVKHAFRVTS